VVVLRDVKNGFTLIELLMVLTIVIVLGLLAYPNYQIYVITQYRKDARAALLSLANQMELYHTLHQTYQTATIAAGKPTDIKRTCLSAQGRYRLSIKKQTKDQFVLQAFARGKQAQRDKQCQLFTLDNLGVKTAKPASAERCW
jgi:type IV pilus assembly protein PilE